MKLSWLKRILPSGLFARSLIILMMPLVIAQMSLGYVFFERHTETILQTIANRLSGNIAIILHWREQAHLPFEELQQLAHQHMALAISFEKGQFLEKEGAHKESWLYSPLVIALNEKISLPYYVQITSEDVIIKIQQKDGVLHVKLLRKLFFSRTTPLVLIWTTISAFVLFLVASLFMRNQIRPIRRLAKAADAFGKGEAHISFKPEGALEVRKAGFAFLNMRERVNRLLSERLEMLAGISHDLRTPITRLKLSAVMLHNKEPQKEQILMDVEMLHQMVEGFLSYGRGLCDEEELVSVNLKQWIFEKVSLHQKILIVLSGNDQAEVSIKPLSLTRCLMNLVENAEKFASSTLWIHVFPVSDGFVSFTLEDDGPGIPPEEFENVFKPFYKIDQARNLNDKPSIGLGLSIAKDIILSHGGEIDLQNSIKGGIQISITLPAT